MSSYTPTPGHFFYVSVKPMKREVMTGDHTATELKTVVVQDNSWRKDIFKCLALDDTHLVAQKKTGYSGDPKLFHLGRYDFAPVGPTVMKAMGLETE